MPDNEFDVGYVANLARLGLTEDEKSRYQGQLAAVLDYIQDLLKVVPNPSCENDP